MEIVFFSSFLDTVATTHDTVPERFLLQQHFVVTTRLGRAVYVWTDEFKCKGSEKQVQSVHINLSF